MPEKSFYIVEIEDGKEKKRMEKFQQLIATIEQNHWPVYGLEIRKNGELLHVYGDTKDTRYPIYSATKSFVSTAAGIAVKEGKFSVKESVYEYLKSEVPAYATEEQKDVLKKLTIERLMTMSVKGYPFRPEGEDWLTDSLLYPLPDVETPEFNYSNIPAYLVGVALEKATGEHLADYLTPRLFEPLGILNPVYGNCPAGHFYGASQMELTVEELGRLGQLYLNGGTWNGERILTEDWVKEATSVKTPCREGGYGYFIWKYKDGFRITGKWGKRCFVFPATGIIVTYLSDMQNNSEDLTEAVMECIGVK